MARGETLVLCDKKANISTPANLTHFNTDFAGLRLSKIDENSETFRTFQEYLQKQTVLANKNATQKPVPPQYNALLKNIQIF